MVLHDVAHRAGVLVVIGALLDAERLGDGDLHVVDVLPVPDRLEDTVREAQHEDVLHGLLAEVVVDAEHLVLAEDLVHDPGELHRRGQVATEWLLHDDARPARATQLVLADGAHDRRVCLRRRGEVEEAIAVRASLDVDAVQRRAECVVARVVRRRDEAHVARERAPHLLVDRFRPAELRDRVVQLPAERVVALRAARRANDGERRGEEPLQREVVERGQQLAPREIARSAEEHERRGLRHTLKAQTLAQRILRFTSRSTARCHSRGGLAPRDHARFAR